MSYKVVLGREIKKSSKSLMSIFSESFQFDFAPFAFNSALSVFVCFMNPL